MMAGVVCVEHSWTRSWNMKRSVAVAEATPPLLSPGAAWDVCVASAAAAGGDAAQAASDLREIQDLRVQPHTAVTRTMQYATDLAACRNGPSAKAFRHRWTHEVQITLLQRRAAMSRTVAASWARRQNHKPLDSISSLGWRRG